jgi:hypothetical protein
MQNRTLLAAVAAAAFAAVVTPSISAAQDTTAKKTTESKGEVAMQPSFGSLISAINSGSANVDKLKSLTSVNASDVQFVNVEDLLKGNDVSALNNALSKNKEGVDWRRIAPQRPPRRWTRARRPRPPCPRCPPSRPRRMSLRRMSPRTTRSSSTTGRSPRPSNSGMPDRDR